MIVTVDASSMIYAWDNYPIEQFPKLWEWLCEEIEKDHLSVSKVAYDEIKKHYEECAEWMDDCGVQKIEISNEILRFALHIRSILGIEGDDYHTKGVGENDILIIATAKVVQRTLISNEGLQFPPPQNLKKCKIPTVCALPNVGVTCIDFLQYIRNSRRVF